MKVIYEKLPGKRKKCLATIGVFDGIHLGHQFILREIKKESQKKDLFSLVITFDTPPQQFLHKNSVKNGSKARRGFIGSITNFEQKISLINSLGIDYLWALKTNQSLLKLSAEDFIAFICKYFEIKELVVGQDFHFGYAGRGDVKYLRKLSSKYNFGLKIIPKKRSKDGKVISSSLIRQFIRKGQLKKAEEFLGRNFVLEGKVGKGKGIGFRLGFPTANIITSDYVIPQQGVYAAYVILRKKIYLAAINIGIRPTFKRAEGIVIEAHIINFCNYILGKIIKIIFLEKIREERKFVTLEQLKTAIAKDVEYITSKYSIPPENYPQLIVR